MSQVSRVGDHKTSIGHDSVGKYVQYHAAKVVRFTPESVYLNSGGWRTNTTKLRMNQASRQFGLLYSVYQKDFKWYVVLPNGTEVPFTDGMQFYRGEKS